MRRRQERNRKAVGRDVDYRELPEEFLNKMRDLLGKEYDAYTASFSRTPESGLRVNRLKPGAGELLKCSGFQLTPVPWIDNGFYYGETEPRPSRHPYYLAGLYYLQEPSAMTPASLIPISEGDCVLDLCAAPGGKSTELAARLHGTGLLFSNDISSSRAKALLKNLELAGAENICVACETPEKLSLCLGGRFHKILVDAPCSGEGMFRKDPDMAKRYLEKGPKYYCGLQKAIVKEAVKLLRPGGMMLYSTCTFDERENEGVIRWLLEQEPELSLIKLPVHNGFREGIGLTECVRLYPHRIGGEGHFMALLQKSGGDSESGKAEGAVGGQIGGTKEGGKEVVISFLQTLKKSFDSDYIYLKNGNAYYLPRPVGDDRAAFLGPIRYLRTGLLLGEVKKERFEPAQALAMSLRMEEAPDALNLDSRDERVIRYLKGETLLLTEGERKPGSGWCLVCTDGFPLGWARRSGHNLKNKYYAGWRWQ